MSPNPPLAALAALCLVGCAPTISGQDFLTTEMPEVTRSPAMAPPDAPEGSCWGHDVTPAVVETVTVPVLVQPAQIGADGGVRQPAVYRNETRPQIVREREEIWFQTPCETDMTPDFVASVQRALEARGAYGGPITGVIDPRTRAAIRRFQKPQGLDSGVLSLAAARQLGLAVAERPASTDG